MSFIKMHKRAFKDLTAAEKKEVLSWFLFYRRRWKKYNTMVMTSYYGSVAYMITKKSITQ